MGSVLVLGEVAYSVCVGKPWVRICVSAIIRRMEAGRCCYRGGEGV